MNVNVSAKKGVAIIRVDANADIGAGHLMRCMALAYGLAKCNMQPVFLVNSTTRKIIQAWKGFPFHYHPLPLFSDKVDENVWLREFITSLHGRLIVLDGYQFDELYRLQIKSLNLPLVLLDDCNDSGQLYADFVINTVNGSETMGYEDTAPTAKLLLGSKYTLLRPEFTAGFSG